MKQSRSHRSSIKHLSPSGFPKFPSTLKFACSLFLAVIFASFSLVVNAQDEDSGDGYEVNVGTNISYGIIYRMEDRHPAYEGTPGLPGNTQYPNNDDGNRNYDKGLVSSVMKVTSEIDISKDDAGFFTRFTGFIDFKNQDGELPYKNLSPKAKELVGSGVKLLDFYGYKNFEVGDVYGDVRVGNMVVNWGESTFVPNGINVVNPFDVSRLRTPGSELREALVPVPMVSASVSPSDNLSVETFYQLKWKKTEIDPLGSYFSTVDFAGEGATTAEIHLTTPPLVIPPNDKDGWLEVTRRADVEPDDSGQFGVALRYFSEQLNGTEFGVFFTRYHSRLPLVNAQSGTATSLSSGLAGMGAVSKKGTPVGTAIITDIAGKLAQNTPLTPVNVGTAVNTAVMTANVKCTGNNVPAGCLTAQEHLSPLEVGQLSGQMTGAILATVQGVAKDPSKTLTAANAGTILSPSLTAVATGFAPQIAMDRYIKGGYYFLEYPEDIDLFGISFNTLLGNSGWALQGELSIHQDVPLQRDEAALFAEGLKPITDAMAYEQVNANLTKAKAGKTLACQDPASDACKTATTQVATLEAMLGFLRTSTQIGTSLGSSGQTVVGYERRDVGQLQLTGTKAFGPILGADGGVFVIEAATTKVLKMPDPKILPLDTSGDIPASASSWGYRAVTKLDFFNAISSINLHPYIQFAHDVSGNTPAPLANFVEGRKTVTLGVSADYLQKWGANLSYTRYSGAGLRNRLGDRDYLQLSVNYSF